MRGQRVARRVRFQASTCFRIGTKLRCMRSTPTARVSTKLRFLVCFAKTGVNAPINAKLSCAQLVSRPCGATPGVFSHRRIPGGNKGALSHL